MIDTVCRPLVLALLSQNVAVRIGGHSLPLCGAGRGVPGSWASDHVSARLLASVELPASSVLLPLLEQQLSRAQKSCMIS